MQISIEEKQKLDAGFLAQFQSEPNRYFSAPGRTEIGGNHTDHQRGCVLAAAVNLDTVAAVKENGTDIIRINSFIPTILRFSKIAIHQYQQETAVFHGILIVLFVLLVPARQV